jgi:ribosomal protein S4E
MTNQTQILHSRQREVDQNLCHPRACRYAVGRMDVVSYATRNDAYRMETVEKCRHRYYISSVISCR